MLIMLIGCIVLIFDLFSAAQYALYDIILFVLYYQNFLYDYITDMGNLSQVMNDYLLIECMDL